MYTLNPIKHQIGVFASKMQKQTIFAVAQTACTPPQIISIGFLINLLWEKFEGGYKKRPYQHINFGPPQKSFIFAFCALKRTFDV